MKLIKRILIGLLLLLVLGIGFLIAAPMLFEEQIVANVKKSINGSLDADVDFGPASLSFLRSFPDISLEVEDLTVTGIDTFAGTPLAAAEQLSVDLGFWSVIAGDGVYQIDAVKLRRPFVNLLVLTPDLANYLIVPETATTSSQPSTVPASAQINLQRFEVEDGTLIYDDRTTETYLEINGLDGVGDGDFTSSVFDLQTNLIAKSFTLNQGGITYLNKVKTLAEATINIDLNQNLYTFLENKVTLNALDLVFGGNIDLEDNGDILFDLEYEAPVNDFRQLWSLLPSAYTSGYEEVKTQGTFTLIGTVDGPYNGEREQYPAFTVRSDISGGSVQYPGRPVGITGIDALLAINSPSSDFNDLVIDISRFDFTLGGDPFKGRLVLATLLSDPQIDGKLDGKVDLAKWRQALPLEGVRDLAGILTADLVFDGLRQSLINGGRYDELDLGGMISLTGFNYVSNDYPAVQIADLRADVSPRTVSIDNFDGKFGRSDLKASGTINNPLAFFSPEQTMRGDVVLRSNFFDADEWMPEEEKSGSASPAELNAATLPSETELFDRFDFAVDAEIGALNYAGYRPENLKAIGTIKPNQLEVASVSGQLGESDFTGSGTVNNLFDYSFGEGVLGGKLSLRSNSVNLNDFMDEELAVAPGTDTEEVAESAVIPVPKNINLQIELKAGEVKYTDIVLQDMVGDLVVSNGEAVVRDGSAALLGGRMKFAGAYDTSEEGDPGFRFHYDLQSLDFSQAFGKLNSFAVLAPLGKFLDGNFSTDLVMEGKLGADLFPKLNTIDARGLLQTAQARINGFKPAVRVGEALNIEELKNSTTIRNLMTVFKVEDGRVEIEPFKTKVAGIPLLIQGKHGLDMDMDYQIQAAVPRDMIGGNIVTGSALAALDRLAGQVSRFGLNVSPGDTLNLAINLGGSISNPTTTFNLLGSSDGDGSPAGDLAGDLRNQAEDRIEEERQRVQDEIDARVEAARADAEARIDSLRAVAGNRAQEVQDSIRRAVAAETDRLRRQAAEQLRLRLDSIRLDSIKNTLPPDVQQAADKLKEELDKFNPFKRKKKVKKDSL